MAQDPEQLVQRDPLPGPSPTATDVNAVTEDVTRIPNVPIAAQGDPVVAIFQEAHQELRQFGQDVKQVARDFERCDDGVARILRGVQNINRNMQQFRIDQALLPMRFHNMRAGENGRLAYPLTVEISCPPLPRTRAELRHMSDIQCDQAASHLELARDPSDDVAQVRRRQVAKYLGVDHFFRTIYEG